MKHLFKFVLIFPYIYFFSWIDKDNRDSKFFPFFYYFYWIYITLYALFSLAWTVFSVLFFNIVLRNVTDIKLWGIWFLFILLAIGLNRLTYFCFKKMLRLRRELGKSKGGKHWFIFFENLFKPRQCRLAVGMVTDFVSSIHNLKTVFLADFISLIYNLKAVLWATCG